MSKRPALGRGLASLIPEAQASPPVIATVENDHPGEKIYSVPIELVDAGRYQPRLEFDDEALGELVQSIRERGILQPLIARPVAERYELIAGERRLRAAKIAGFATVPVIVRDATDTESLELALIENIQRDDLNAIELARGFRQLQEEFGYTQEEVSRRVGKDRTTVTNHLRLLKLPEVVKEALAASTITMGHARALLGLESEDLQAKALEQIQERELSVREAEGLVKRLKRTPPAPKRNASPGIELIHQTERLKRTFQTQVEIHPRKNGSGEIRIAFYSNEELNRILELIPEPR